MCNLRVAVIAFRPIRDILWCKADAVAAYTGQLALRACWANDPGARVRGWAGGGGRVAPERSAVPVAGMCAVAHKEAGQLDGGRLRIPYLQWCG
eukprot:COSAG03_NODE_36_length_17658_cov_56.766900_1_plen_94_part_00